MYDIAIIGGGINGCGIARDLAGRGLSVLLAEMNDLASGTSSWSTKLIHGGLRYLEHYEFQLVRAALREREVLWKLAPHLVRPARFVLPHHEGLRPAWLLRLGLFLYDHIGGRRDLPASRLLNLQTETAGGPLKPQFRRGFEYADCRVDDARLVIANARDAADRGADIKPRTRVTDARREGDHWQIALQDQSGKEHVIEARLLINAAGPWIDIVLRDVLSVPDARNVRLVRGSHMVVPKLFDGETCYIFQNQDGRIVFAIPFEQDFTLIGTTDADHEGDPGEAAISDSEADYLCRSVNNYFKGSVSPDQAVWTFSGVRPLIDDGSSAAQSVTRDYDIRVERPDGDPPLINIFGGKLTTYRKLAEKTADMACEMLGAPATHWSGEAPLPGGDFEPNDAERLADALVSAASWLDKPNAQRLVRLYGTRANDVVSGADVAHSGGKHFGAGLYACEVDYLRQNEWAMDAEDIVWRRTKLGLKLTPQQVSDLQRWLDTARPA